MTATKCRALSLKTKNQKKWEQAKKTHQRFSLLNQLPKQPNMETKNT